MEPHKILGINQDATLEEVHQAYRKQASRYHPDHGGDAWAFQQVREAYERLVSEHALAADDRGGQSTADQPAASDPRRPRSPLSPDSTTQSSGQRTSAPRDAAGPLHWLWQLGFRELPLQNETTTFILVNMLDVFMTYILLRFGAIEANPIARFFLQRWDFSGMIFFKMGLVAFVCVVVQLIAHRNLTKARRVLQAGTLVVGIVVVYGAVLFARKFGGRSHL